VPDTGQGANQTDNVTVDPAGLAGGVYHGTVTIGEEGLASVALPVTLGVWSSPPPLTIISNSFTFVQTVGQAAPVYQMAQVDSAGVPVPLTNTPRRIGAGVSAPSITLSHFVPFRISFRLFPPGEYDGSLTIQSPGNSLYVPGLFWSSRGRLRRRCFPRS
jgi:hypothetical protein